ncbi:hypothetical protein EPA93_15295 [Ktedonosporobacter rubrisoli]|uniref:Glutamate--cysteine ligase n=1 Tax=Ktedonosporobacter rubrisoli TaxID=2509675 RepID=A0A4P6JPX2_KTERU|nr:hypothetical protein [Ktedonosporobacter rubrisoli]QBD77283.1 hypothetical protein EPA93_15295 [Ktedonosporobacter rubrisoli]
MNAPEPSPASTYGGEVETLAVEGNTGRLFPVASLLQQHAQKILSQDRELSLQRVVLDYDEAEHILEFRGVVAHHLPQLISTYRRSLVLVQELLRQHSPASLLSSSFHPLEDPSFAYQYVVPKPLYELFQGPLQVGSHVPFSALSKIYPTNPERGRGWSLELGAMAASIQPWNSLPLEGAASQIALLQAMGWMFNLLTANSPFLQGTLSDKRDYRLEVWGDHGLLASSRYLTDLALTKNLPTRPAGLTDYYRYVLRQQRPLVLPLRKETGSANEYKYTFLGIIQPNDTREFNALTYLQMDQVRAVDIETGEEQDVHPSVAHLFNGFDFLYYPRYGARIRLHLPEADQLDPKLFAQAVESRNEPLFHSLLRQAKVQTGFLCAEGRIPATVLPTHTHPGWERFSIPFVLQTALVRSQREVFTFLASTPLTWYDLAHRLPSLCNERTQGFSACVKGINATELARQIWALARQRLTEEEVACVNNEIEEILDTRMAPAEEQVALFETLSQRTTKPSAFRQVIEHCSMI